MPIRHGFPNCRLISNRAGSKSRNAFIPNKIALKLLVSKKVRSRCSQVHFQGVRAAIKESEEKRHYEFLSRVKCDVEDDDKMMIWHYLFLAFPRTSKAPHKAAGIAALFPKTEAYGQFCQTPEKAVQTPIDEGVLRVRDVDGSERSLLSFSFPLQFRTSHQTSTVDVILIGTLGRSRRAFDAGALAPAEPTVGFLGLAVADIQRRNRRRVDVAVVSHAIMRARKVD